MSPHSLRSRALALVDAITQTETRGASNCNQINGLSGERGCLQYTQGAWEGQSVRVLGYITDRTQINERYVAWKQIEMWLDAGYDEREISRIWNSGSTRACTKGTNKHGVKYNTCAYVQTVLAYLK